MNHSSLSRNELILRLQALEAQNESLNSLLSTLKDGIITISGQGTIHFMNGEAEALTGWNAEEARGKSCEEVIQLVDHFTSKPVVLDIREILEYNRGREYSGYLDIRDRNGSVTHITAGLFPLKGDRTRSELVITLHDITEKRHMREEINRIQKLDALSKLAGGIAHSFNNMLTGIMGFSELMFQELDEKKEHELLAYNKEILDTCERASDVTGELLNFSRKRNTACKEIDLNLHVEETAVQLKALLNPSIELVTEIKAENSIACADPFQIKDIILNLGKNARDALDGEGRIAISTANRYFDREECQKRSRLMNPGNYYMLTVDDTGPGIPPDALPHIFEPFFTTKKFGTGSGLGLSSVYGSVISHGGNISIKTKEGVGTSFEIALPLMMQESYPESPTGKQ